MARRRFQKKRFNQAGKRRKRGDTRVFDRKHGKRYSGQETGPIAEADILGYLFDKGDGVTFAELLTGLGLARKYRKALHSLLDELCRRDVLTCKEKVYALKGSAELVEGVISVNPRGFAFASVPQPPPGMVIKQDLFIAPQDLGTAAHGDRVLLQIAGARRERLEARVVRVLERGRTRLVGTYMAGGATGLVVPEDEHFPFQVVIHREHSLGARNGEAVVVEITEHKSGHHNAVGRIIEVLGDPDDIRVQTEITIRKYELPHVFDAAALEQAEALDAAIRPTAGREDFRDILHVTIDGESARDFDDAVAVQKSRTGYRLYVSIADVGHYVPFGSPLDKEAYRRGTSVYFPTRVVPMLPERLSNNLCSLVPGEDRYGFTAVLDFDRSGKRKGKAFARSIIRSRHRLTYTVVKKILLDKDAALRRQYKPILTPLKWMADLAALLEGRRMARGSIGFEIPEAEIVLDDNDRVTGIKRLERNIAHKLIEEFMLAANEAVAGTFTEQGLAGMYRIHEAPDPAKIAEFSEFAQGMGLALPSGAGSPAWFAKVLQAVSGTPQEYIVNNLLLRTMKQACYSPENIGHFGLAASDYTHFTSPIRRYPDLMVHRALAAWLAPPKAGKKRETAGQVDLREAGLFLSKRERVAVDAEREMVDRLKVRFMADKIGETFDGVISGVIHFGFFVELIDYFISGAVAVTDLSDDYYKLDERSHRMVGKRSNKMYQIGDLVRVRVKDVNVRRRRIDFLLEEPSANADT